MLYIVRYGEIALKKGTRASFEKKLVDNIGAVLKRAKIKYSIKRVWGRLFVETSKPADNLLKKVFGIVSFSPCEFCEPEIEKIKRLAAQMAKKTVKPGQTFAVRAHRESKNGLSSQRINEIVGEVILKSTKGKVNLKKPRHIIGIEIRDKAYVYIKKILGPGGLPEGIEGKVLAIIKKRQDLAAAWLAMRRGCMVIPVFKKEEKFFLDFFRKWSALPLKYYKYHSICDIKKIIIKERIEGIVEGNENFLLEKIGIPVFRPLLPYQWAGKQIPKY